MNGNSPPACALLGRDPDPRTFRIQAAVAIPLAILDTALGDIHGLPFLAGLAVGIIWVLRDERKRAGREPRWEHISV